VNCIDYRACNDDVIMNVRLEAAVRYYYSISLKQLRNVTKPLGQDNRPLGEIRTGSHEYVNLYTMTFGLYSSCFNSIVMEETVGMVWTGFIWLRIGTSGGIL